MISFKSHEDFINFKFGREYSYDLVNGEDLKQFLKDKVSKSEYIGLFVNGNFDESLLRNIIALDCDYSNSDVMLERCHNIEYICPECKETHRYTEYEYVCKIWADTKGHDYKLKCPTCNKEIKESELGFVKQYDPMINLNHNVEMIKVFNDPLDFEKYQIKHECKYKIMSHKEVLRKLTFMIVDPDNNNFIALASNGMHMSRLYNMSCLLYNATKKFNVAYLNPPEEICCENCKKSHKSEEYKLDSILKRGNRDIRLKLICPGCKKETIR